HAGGDRGGAREVEPPGAAFRRHEHAGRGDRERRGDRNVDEQDPPPRQVVDDQPAEDEPDRAAAAGSPGVDAQGSVARGALGERVGDERQGGWRDDGAAGTLDDPGDDQPRRGGRDPARERSAGEEQDARDEPPAASEKVTG